LNLQTNFYHYRKPDDKFEGWILDILRLIEISRLLILHLFMFCKMS